MNKTHKVTTDALETLGTIIGEGAGRDAIHLAVEPVIAGEDMLPGTHIGIKDGVAINKTKRLGIADPFLNSPIKKGEKFWMIIYPRTITSLRHVWVHPDFPEEVSKPDTSFSEAWIRDFADRLNITYSDLMEGAEDYCTTGSRLYMGDNEDYYDFQDEMGTFWNHFYKIKGLKPEWEGLFFSCSC